MHLLPFFGDRPLQSVTAEDGLNYVSQRIEQTAAPGTIWREFQVLNRLLTLAVRYKRLDANRLKGVDLPEPVKRRRVAEPDELERIRTARCRSKNETESLAELWRVVIVAVNTGLREGKILSIRRTWIRKLRDGYWLALPPASTRLKGNPSEIPLNRAAARPLMDEMPSVVDERVFRRWRNARSFKKRWDSGCERARVTDLHFHDLRHVFATRLQRLGVGYEIRQALLGHKMPGITADYSHGGREWEAKLREAVTRLGRAYPMVYEMVYRRVTEVGASEVVDFGEPRGTRTHGPRLKRAMLYLLS